MILSFDQTTGQIINTVVGNGVHDNLGDGGPATLASISYPAGIAFDKNGNYYFTTGTSGNSIRKISTDGF